MKLSTKGRYASRAMLELALHEREGPVQLKRIAEIQNISVRYLERVMRLMLKAGLVRSHQGRKGGFTLAKPPRKIHLYHIVEAAEGPIAFVHCVDDPKGCNQSESCVTRLIWERVNKEIIHTLDSITLQDMVEMHHSK